MTIDTTQALLIVILAIILRDGLLAWFLIARSHAQPIPTPGPAPAPSPVGPAPPIPVPPVPVPIPAPAPAPAPTKASDFPRSVALTLKWEGGNDDDPHDPGGRTSRGIIQTEWNKWRQTHPGLPADVWQAPQAEVLAIYKQNYWDAMNCDSLPPGVDYAIFDYGVNSGIGRAPKVLQRILGVAVDGAIGPATVAAISTDKAPVIALINQICDERLHFLQGLSTWGNFGRGWTTRVAGVRKDALAMVNT